MLNRRRRNAFTLVELLVVIGIISVLISILLPSLGKARQSANSLACASNMRSIGQMFYIYMTNNKGNLPLVMTDNTYFFATAWPSAISYDGRQADNTWGAIVNNIANKKVFLCPFYAGGDAGFSNVERTYVASGMTFYNSGGGGFRNQTPNPANGQPLGKNNTVFGNRSILAPSGRYWTGQLVKPSKIKASTTVMIMESIPRAEAWGGAATFSVAGEPYGTADFYDWFLYLNGPYAHAFKNANYLFVDGHVETIAPPVKYKAGQDWYPTYAINNGQFNRMFSVDKTRDCMDDGR